jgi:hypothetical protein
MSILSKLGILAIVVALAFGAGFYTEHKFNQASQVVAVQKEVKNTAAAIQQSTAASQKIETVAATKEAAVQSVVKAVNARLDQPRKTATQHDTSQAPGCEEPATAGDQLLPFDVDTVRLLNAARQGIAVSAAPSGDADVASAPAAAGAARHP